MGGFFSSSLIDSALLKRNVVFFIAALLGAFLTAASLLRLTRGVFFGKPPKIPKKSAKIKIRKESPVLTVPMSLLALMTLLCTWNVLPMDAIGKAFVFTESFSGLPKSWLSALLLCAALALALLDHVLGGRNSGSALTAADHLRFIPGVRQLYSLAETGALDPLCVADWFDGGAVPDFPKNRRRCFLDLRSRDSGAQRQPSAMGFPASITAVFPAIFCWRSAACLLSGSSSFGFCCKGG